MTAPRCKSFAFSSCSTRRCTTSKRRCNHCATALVKVSGDNVQHVHQPCIQGSKRHRVDTNASVHRRRWCCTHLSCESNNDIGRHTSNATDCLWRKRCNDCFQFIQTIRDGRNTRFYFCDAFSKHHVQQRRHKQTIGARTNGHPLVRFFCCFCSTWVDHNHFPATCTNGLDATWIVRRCAQTSI